MAITSQSSVLSSAANKIVSANVSSTGSFVVARKEYKKFGDFLYIKTLEIERSETPSQNTLKKLSRLNISNTFGSAGGLLGSLLGGALDLGGLIRGFFPGKDKKIGQAPSATTAKTKPKMKGSRLRISGGRALPIVGSLFAGLDFATGLAEGESIGKSAAGTSGALAGSLLGGAIGQTLIPVPGLGFVIGSAVGGFLGGWTADRAYDAGTSMLSKPKAIQEQKLEEGKKKEEPKVKEDMGLIMRQNSLIANFDGAVNKFSELVDDFISGKVSIFSQGQFDENYEPVEPPPPPGPGPGEEYTGPISGDTFLPLPNAVSIGHQPRQMYNAERSHGPHRGVDLTEAPGSPRPLSAPVVAYKTGKVSFIDGTNSQGPGGFIILNHGGGLETVYIHIIPRKGLRVGQLIYGGQEIAKLWPDGGNTHLHFEVRQNGKHVNPTGYARGAKNKLSSPLSDLNAKLQHEKNAGTQSQTKPTQSPNNLDVKITPPKVNGGQSSPPPNRMPAVSSMVRSTGIVAQNILNIGKEDPNINFRVSSGATENQSGGVETTMNGYPEMIAMVVGQLAEEQGVANVSYSPSPISGDTSTYKDIQRKLSKISAVSPTETSLKIAYDLPYNQQGAVVLNNLIAMVQQQSPTPPRVASTPFSMPSSGESMTVEDNNSSISFKDLQILKNSVT